MNAGAQPHTPGHHPTPVRRFKKRITRLCLLLVIGLGLFMIWLLLGPWAAHSGELTRQHQETEAAQAELSTRNLALKKNAERQQHAAHELQLKHAGVAHELDDLRGHAKVVIGHNRKLEAAVQEQGEVIAGFRQQCNSPAEIAWLKRENEQTRTDLNKARAVVESGLRAIQSLRSKLARMDLAAQGYAEDSRKNARELASVKKQLGLASGRVKNLSQENRALSRENTSLKARKPVVIQAPPAKSGEAEKLRRQLAEARRQVNELGEVNENLISRTAELTSKLSRLEDSPPAQNPTAPFAILSYNSQFKLASANFGSRQGAQPGQQFQVTRDGRAFGWLIARKVEPNRTILTFAPGSPVVTLKPGDVLRPLAK